MSSDVLVVEISIFTNTTLFSSPLSTTASHNRQYPSSREHPYGDDNPFPVHQTTVEVAEPLHPALCVL
jgi:hypothetical protein